MRKEKKDKMNAANFRRAFDSRRSWFLFFGGALLFSSCVLFKPTIDYTLDGLESMVTSTPPENPGDVYDIRNRAEKHLELGNKEADRGDFETALLLLDEAMRLAITADDSGLRIRCRLSHSNVLFSLGRREEAAEGWNEALAEAEQIENDELAAVCRIHIERARLLSPEGASAAAPVHDAVTRDVALITSERLYIALGWMVIALAEKELGDYAAAEAAVRRSLAIHEEDRYFELAAYDWYMIASFRSLAADYKGARQALENALIFDRRVENSWGLASDWRALGDVHTKAGDRAAARAAYQRSADIFRALGNEQAAADTLSKIETP